MTEKLIPASTSLAAKRGFIRTTTQAYAATLSAGVSATVILAVINGEIDTTTAVVSLVVALISPPLAGLVSYLQITANGIPEDYTPALPPQDADTGAPVTVDALEVAESADAKADATYHGRHRD